MCIKQGGSSYVIPFEIPFLYVHPQIDAVPPKYHVTPPTILPPVSEIKEAVELYLTAYRHQFPGPLAAKVRGELLSRFLEYVQAHHHSMQLADLDFADGKAFLGTLVNAYTGAPLSLSIRTGYKSALRSFSRFLVKSNLVEEDVFFALKVH